MNIKQLFLPLALGAIILISCNLPGVILENAYSPEPTDEEVLQMPIAPSPTPIPTASEELCLVGTWEVRGLSDYILAFIPQEMIEQYDLEYKGTTGEAFFSLFPDGSLTMQADQLEILFEARASIFTVPVTASLDGEVRGKYSVDGDTLTTSDMNTSGLTASAQAMGNELMNQAQIINAIPLMRAPYNTARFSCSGDTLQLRLPAYPDSLPPLVFQRVN